jgi:hypothetical protein
MEITHMHRIRIFCAALLLLAGAAHAGIDNAGTTSANFLSVGAGASVLSMGGAAIGTGGSLTASAWNPAALGLVAGPQYSISHAALAMQTSQDWVAAGGTQWYRPHIIWAIVIAVSGVALYRGRGDDA